MSADERALDKLVHSLDADAIRDLFQRAGYRAEIVTDTDGARLVRSSTGGLAFHVRLADPLSGDTPTFAAANIFAALQVQGTLPLSIVNRWNASKRYARLYLAGDVIMLDMDISVLGGVTMSHLPAQVLLWDRLVQDLLRYLREAVAGLAANEGSPAPVDVMPDMNESRAASA